MLLNRVALQTACSSSTTVLNHCFRIVGLVSTKRLSSETANAAPTAEDGSPAKQDRGSRFNVVRTTPDAASRNTNLQIGNLGLFTGEEHIIDYFSKYGEVKNVIVNYNKRGFSRGNAYVRFRDHESYAKVMEEPVHKLDSHQVKVELVEKQYGRR